MPPKLVLEETGDAGWKEMPVEEAITRVAHSKLQIVDVRGAEEYASGYIKGSKHVPYEDLMEGPDADKNASELLGSLKAAGSEQVLIVCMYSQGTGPTIAQRLTTLAEETGIHFEVSILDGGFHGFVNKAQGGGAEAKAASDLLVGFKPEHWCMTPKRGLVQVNAVLAVKELGVPEEGAEQRQPDESQAPQTSWGFWSCCTSKDK
mmetsp:Transcript_33390/g.85088  ORF Transcript_33390/g.85088 Transcript_33390/m.85088 type:complete len:205 (-) Transcript_33390:55-669(-)|eukprot:CAMPEP_0183386008 /NCGR_PEP_ID=MMETSP0370-20130417/2019_1 /TAXON_ID=268820 /ORGANISM="Peridinium aciculiferum, Strain PAER-2" /LENGTH=204 /DNA_ID=CAMNT_0025564207 /DNA_START=58 /DNA_END=672 /DNA_ORIENTATION=+